MIKQMRDTEGPSPSSSGRPCLSGSLQVNDGSAYCRICKGYIFGDTRVRLFDGGCAHFRCAGWDDCAPELVILDD